MKDEAEEWRAKLVEAVAEYDDTLMEKFFEDPNSISETEIHEAIRKVLLISLSFRCCVVLPSRTRVFRRCWMRFAVTCHLQWISKP
jgi:translation elongation factor EF-G